MAGTALAASAFTKKSEHVTGDRRDTVYDVAFNNSYTPGGYVVSPRTVGLTTKIDSVKVNNSGGYVVDAIPQSDGTVKLLVQTSNGAAPGALADFTSAGDLSAVTAARCRFTGF